MRQIAIYGKGGIGKSTVTANLAVAFAERGLRVLQIGCDPKHDSTRLLLGGELAPTVLDLVRDVGAESVRTPDFLRVGYRGVLCVEAGGPEPGVGCAGRGILATFELLERLGVIRGETGGGADGELDVVLYDVLGDVVCGGFAAPIREGYAREVYLVSSGELMSLYAANNIAKGVARFAGRGRTRLGGVIGNSRDLPNEERLLAEFADRLGTSLLPFVPRDGIVQRAEVRRQTVMQFTPASAQAERYRALAAAILANDRLSCPRPLELAELETLVERSW